MDESIYDIVDKNIMRLSNIIRYNTQTKIKNESVAEHSFYVAYYTNYLCTKYGLGDKIRLLALEAAILHDVPEIYTNDITHDVKQEIPQINALLSPIEEKVIHKHSADAHKVLFGGGGYQYEIANKVVELADIISVLKYCEREANLGNKSFFELQKYTVDRAKKCEQELGELKIIHNKNLKMEG